MKMMDGRRHSVDIPISKALVALRRVRSLRDPSTNSTSKFSTLVENLNWETNSTDGISLGFISGSKEGAYHNDFLGLQDYGLCGRMEEHFGDHELYYRPRKPNTKFDSCEKSSFVRNTGGMQMKTIVAKGSNLCQSNHEGACGNKLLSERYSDGFGDKGLNMTCITPSSACLEGVGSCSEPIEGSRQLESIDHNASKRKPRHRRHVRSSRAAAGDFMSHTGSPCLSISDILLGGSSRGTSSNGNEDVEVVDLNHRGCGLSCCWSRTPRFRESNLPYDLEDQPLLSGEVDVAVLSGQGRGCKPIGNASAAYSQSPRSLSQKFRPKSFNELVGQNVLAKSLLNAVSLGKITPFYLFHGPRGTGKTSASRIFAAALNCLSHEDNRPCGVCRECVLFFSGRSRDVKEVDSVRINGGERVRYLIKHAKIPPVSSRYKVFIFDECHLLRGATWDTFFSKLEDLSGHVVFIMITPDLEKLPRSALSRSQRYYFPKLKEADIMNRLAKICVAERVDYDQVALDFIASKSNGSLRDAEMMLEQLSLLGKKITISLAYELTGVVSDEELLDLLDLALSSDTSNTVRRARELMRSRIDPLQLISQLANIIMDILAGKCQEGASEVKTEFFKRHTSEADLQQLSHALKILSETEKQLRTTKNQTTWLTVALLQLSSVGLSFVDANDSRLCLRTVHPTDGDFCSTSSTGESLKHVIPCACDKSNSSKLGLIDDKGILNSMWHKSTGLSESNSLKNFLRRRGNLACVYFNQGMAVVELEFHHPEYVSKAEKSWKSIASGLQSILGCNVEIRINLVPCISVTMYSKLKKQSFSLFSCSRRLWHESQSTSEQGSDPSENSNSTSEKAMIKGKFVESDCGSQMLPVCCHSKQTACTRSGEGNALRNSEGNALSVGMTISHRLLTDNMPKQHGVGVDSSKKERSNCACEALSAHEPEKHPSCFLRTMKSHNKLHSSDASQMACLRIEPRNNLVLSLPSRTSSEACMRASNPYIFCCSSNNHETCSGDENSRRKNSKVCCWRTPTFPFKKVTIV
ncbi:unnamed protein product [Ilex paraguariensis]|uniref:DNA-directed DNA polymerase n=1 Tax=Ilex paraguariensis TaxID=185542 RepID=A0ABC8QXL9_9AQUA